MKLRNQCAFTSLPQTLPFINQLPWWSELYWRWPFCIHYAWASVRVNNSQLNRPRRLRNLIGTTSCNKVTQPQVQSFWQVRWPSPQEQYKLGGMFFSVCAAVNRAFHLLTCRCNLKHHDGPLGANYFFRYNKRHLLTPKCHWQTFTHTLFGESWNGGWVSVLLFFLCGIVQSPLDAPLVILFTGGLKLMKPDKEGGVKPYIIL